MLFVRVIKIEMFLKSKINIVVLKMLVKKIKKVNESKQLTSAVTKLYLKYYFKYKIYLKYLCYLDINEELCPNNLILLIV